jgi:hypothetical protein
LESDFHSLCVNQRSLIASIFARLGCHGIMSQGLAPQQALFRNNDAAAGKERAAGSFIKISFQLWIGRYITMSPARPRTETMARPDVRIVSICLARVSPETRGSLHTVARNPMERRGGMLIRALLSCEDGSRISPLSAQL